MYDFILVSSLKKLIKRFILLLNYNMKYIRRTSVKNFGIKLSLLLFPLLLSTSLFSANETKSCSQGPGYIIDEHKMISGYNAPDKLCLVCPQGFFLEGSFIYWQAREGGLNIALNTENSKNTAIKIPCNFAPGFKIAVGINKSQDNWKGYFQYTRLSSSGKKSKEAIMYPFWSIPPSNNSNQLTSNCNGKWNLAINLFDISLGRSFYTGVKVSFNPFFGIKAGWIDQKMIVKYNEYTLESFLKYRVKIKSKSDSWLIGPSAGVDIYYHLGSAIKLFGKASTSIYYQHFDLQFDQTREASKNIFASDDHGQINPFLYMSLGINWEKYFLRNRWHLELLAGYDLNIFWNQNQLRSLKDNLKNHINGSCADLILHGLTLSANLSF